MKSMFSGSGNKVKKKSNKTSPSSESKTSSSSGSKTNADSSSAGSKKRDNNNNNKNNDNASASSSSVEEPPAQTTTPRADVTLPDRPLTDRRRTGSRQAQRDNAANHFPILPKLMSVSLKDRPGLFVQKLTMCEQGFTFTGDV